MVSIMLDMESEYLNISKGTSFSKNSKNPLKHISNLYKSVR